MPYRYFLFLHLIRRFNGERTLSGIFHLLRGKQSAQTIQDSFLFHVEPFFHSFDGMDRRIYDHLSEECKKRGWTVLEGAMKEKCMLTLSGLEALKRFEKNCSFPDGLSFTENINSETDFWLKLQLMVQTLSELAHQRNAFLPVTRQAAVTESVRRFLKNSALDRRMLARSVFEELRRLMVQIPKGEADMLAAQMTGSGMSGLTVDQLSHYFGRDTFECQLLFKSALRRLLHQLAAGPSDFPNLGCFLDRNRGTLSASAGQTFRFLREGLSIETISKKRKLSLGTIEDHVVEIALKIPDFDEAFFLPEQVNRQICEAVSRMKTRQLKPIKELLHDRASYFQIRLALAKDAVRREACADGNRKIRFN